MKTLRTPDDRFSGLAGFDFEPHYSDVPDQDGGSLRMHYLDEGDRNGDIVVLLHGEPSWCYLYRTMIPVLTEAGLRCIAPDLVGFGRSDKPAERSDYTYARHVEWMRSLLLDRLGIDKATMFGQDWGGLVGLRVVAENPDRFARVVIGNTGLPTGDGEPSEAFMAWRDFSQRVENFDVGFIVSGAVVSPMTDEVKAAYNAPFPDDSYKEGARQFPVLVPVSPDDPAAEANVAAREVFTKWTKPFLTLFSDSDPVTKGGDWWFRKHVPGAEGQPHAEIEQAGHFLQEDKGPEIARHIVEFVSANSTR